jgi:hypothetical protein
MPSGVNPRRLALMDDGILPNLKTEQAWDLLQSELWQLRQASKGDLTYDQRRRKVEWCIKLTKEIRGRGVQLRLQM